MRIPKASYRLPLQAQIGLVFVALILLIGATLALVSYRQISGLILASTGELFDDIVVGISARFQQEYRPLTKTVELLSMTRLVQSSTSSEQLAALPLLAEALHGQPNVTSIMFGYTDGTYLVARSTRSQPVRRAFMIPPAYTYIIDRLTPDGGGGMVGERRFFDDRLQLGEVAALSADDYDPRDRPWYRNTEHTTETRVTEPYYFYFTHQPGITVSRRDPATGTVVAADITLQSLSETLERSQVSPSAISLLYNSAGEIYAYSAPDQAAVFGDVRSGEQLNIDDLSSPIIERIASSPRRGGVAAPFEFNGQTWLGDIRSIELRHAGGRPLQLLVAAPEVELFAKAFGFRRTSFFITLSIILVTLPLVGLLANQIARPLRRLADQTRAITRFDFDQPFAPGGHTREVFQLSSSLEVMKTTIGNFISLITSLSGESDLNRLLERVTNETMLASRADAALIFLLADDEQALVAGQIRFSHGRTGASIAGIRLPLDDADCILAQHYRERRVGALSLQRDVGQSQALRPLFDALGSSSLTAIALPLQNRKLEGMGILCLFYTPDNHYLASAASAEGLGYAQALSGFAAVSMESRQLINLQKALLESFIQLLAGAIDAKSPYTGGHCQRVPVITQMLAAAACASDDPRFADFDLDDEGWEALRIASWLHDCGKVTTPEYVVDKATKLETITDRIHEIRMRFEVLKRDAHIERWQRVAQGGDAAAEQLRCEARCRQLDDDFAFVAECNIGGEFMSDQKIERLHRLAAISWQRTLSDRLGISWEEKLRKERTPEPQLPVAEPLLADRPDQIILRREEDRIPADNPLGFRVDTPEHLYNHGELYNLSVRKGTLTPEERYIINDHMVQTITMLNALPYPKHLRSVPEIAGGHHETMDGKGYPKRLCKAELSMPARMMAIADIFEALTAADRPYKKAKTLSETIRIMSFMVRDRHIDADLFELFLRSGVYLQYAREYLQPEQIDEVDLAAYLPETAAGEQPA